MIYRIVTTTLCLLFLCTTALNAQYPPKASEPQKVLQPPQKEAAREESPTYKVEGLELTPPQEVDPDERYVVVQAKTDGDYKVESVGWIVVSMSQKPVKYTELDNSVIVGLPQKGEAVLVYADALLYKEVQAQTTVEIEINGEYVKKKANLIQKEYKKTKWATTLVAVKGAPPPPPGPGGNGGGTPGQPTDPQTGPVKIPPQAGRVHVVVVLDNIAGDVRQKSLFEAKNWRETLKQEGHLTYVYDGARDDATLKAKGLRDLITKSIGGGPAIIVMSSDGRPLPTGQAIRLPITDDPQRNELIVLDLAGRAAGGR